MNCPLRWCNNHPCLFLFPSTLSAKDNDGIWLHFHSSLQLLYSHEINEHSNSQYREETRGGKLLSYIDKAHLYSGFETLIWILIYRYSFLVPSVYLILVPNVIWKVIGSNGMIFKGRQERVEGKGLLIQHSDPWPVSNSKLAGVVETRLPLMWWQPQVSFVVFGCEAVSQMSCLNCLGNAFKFGTLGEVLRDKLLLRCPKWHSGLSEWELKLELWNSRKKVVLNWFSASIHFCSNIFPLIRSVCHEGQFQKAPLPLSLCCLFAQHTHVLGFKWRTWEI